MSVVFVASISYTAQRLGSSISDQNSVKLLWLQRIIGFIIGVIVPVNIEFTQSRRGRTARKKDSRYENESSLSNIRTQVSALFIQYSFSYPEPFLRAVRRGALAKSITGYHKNMVRKQCPVLELANQMPVRNIDLARGPRRTARKKGSGYENVQYFNMADSVDLAHGFS